MRAQARCLCWARWFFFWDSIVFCTPTICGSAHIFLWGWHSMKFIILVCCKGNAGQAFSRKHNWMQGDLCPILGFWICTGRLSVCESSTEWECFPGKRFLLCLNKWGRQASYLSKLIWFRRCLVFMNSLFVHTTQLQSCAQLLDNIEVFQIAVFLCFLCLLLAVLGLGCGDVSVGLSGPAWGSEQAVKSQFIS